MAKQTGRTGMGSGAFAGAAAGRGDSTTIPLASITARAQTVLPSADATRVSGLRGLQLLRTARHSGLSRALEQLKEKHGADDPRTVGIQKMVDADAAFVQHLAAEAERAATPPVVAAAGSYIVHGRVRDETLAGLGKYVVTLTHTPGEDDQGPRSKATDDSGYFKIAIKGVNQPAQRANADPNAEADPSAETDPSGDPNAGADPNSGADPNAGADSNAEAGAATERMAAPKSQQPKPGQKVAPIYLRVLDSNGNAVHDDSRALLRRSAAVDYVEMVVPKRG
jgi:hypothetical protein